METAVSLNYTRVLQKSSFCFFRRSFSLFWKASLPMTVSIGPKDMTSIRSSVSIAWL